LIDKAVLYLAQRKDRGAPTTLQPMKYYFKVSIGFGTVKKFFKFIREKMKC